jgi:hypothetical protein
MSIWKAFARKSDPDTSHMAAATHEPVKVMGRAKAIYKLLFIPMTDEQLVDAYQAAVDAGLAQPSSPQAIRTSRCQLVYLEAVEMVEGQYGTTRMGNKARIWRSIPETQAQAQLGKL